MSANQPVSRTNQWRRRRDSNPRIEVLQTSTPPLGVWEKSSKAAHAGHPLLRMRYAVTRIARNAAEFVAIFLIVAAFLIVLGARP